MRQFLLILLLPCCMLTLCASAFAHPGAMQNQYILQVHGMSCKMCAAKTKKMLMKIKGVKAVNVDLKKSTVAIYTSKGFCFSKPGMNTLRKNFKNLGYKYKKTLAHPKNCH